MLGLQTTEGSVPSLKEELPEVRCIGLQSGCWTRMERALDDKDNENSCLVAYFESGQYFAPELLRKKMIH